MYIDLVTCKKHLNIDEYYTKDDDYLIHLIKSAEDAVSKRLNVKHLSHLINPYTGGLPEDVIHSILLLIGSWYAQRETFAFQSIGQLTHNFDFLADLNRNYKEPF